MGCNRVTRERGSVAVGSVLQATSAVSAVPLLRHLRRGGATHAAECEGTDRASGD
jgi:hypothetical protein